MWSSSYHAKCVGGGERCRLSCWKFGVERYISMQYSSKYLFLEGNSKICWCTVARAPLLLSLVYWCRYKCDQCIYMPDFCFCLFISRVVSNISWGSRAKNILILEALQKVLYYRQLIACSISARILVGLRGHIIIKNRSDGVLLTDSGGEGKVGTLFCYRFLNAFYSSSKLERK